LDVPIPSGKALASFPARLDADWEVLVRRPEAAALLESLSTRHSGPRWVDANALVAAIESTHDDTLVHQLVSAAQEPSEEGQTAARIIIEALRPLIARVARQISFGSTNSDAFAHVTAELYQVIRTLPLHRPSSTLANLRMELVGSLFGERRAHHPAARRAISTAVPSDDIEALYAARAALDIGLGDMGKAPSLVEDSALVTVHALGVLRRAEAAGLRTGEESRQRIELLEMLVWGLNEGVLTDGQARALADYESSEAAASPQQFAAVSRARQRGLSRLRCALPRYLASKDDSEARLLGNVQR
jgi:hypothetical protein